MALPVRPNTFGTIPLTTPVLLVFVFLTFPQITVPFNIFTYPPSVRSLTLVPVMLPHVITPDSFTSFEI